MIVMCYGWMNALWMDGWLMNWYANMVSCARRAWPVHMP